MEQGKLSLGLFLCAAIVSAGPVEFGLAEYNAALASRGLKWKVTAELSLDAPETFRIEPYTATAGGAHITGGDLRGLMYGLIEASEQIRANGRLAPVHRVPYAPVRGIRLFVHDRDLAKYPDDFWRAYFQTLARDRFNRFNLVFLEANPYPFLVAVDGYSGVRVPGLSNDQRDRNLRILRFISQTAADYAIEFTLGIWDNPPSSPRSPVEGLTYADIGPYSHDALRKLLAVCPMIRRLQINARSEEPGFYADYIFKALHEAGRRVTLDPRGSLREPEFVKSAQKAGVALEPSLGTWPGGFELDPPLEPGHWEFEHHELFYWLWGRFGYDPQTKPPKGEKPDEYAAADRIVHLLIAAHFSDPNMYTWPVANPGGRTGDQDDRPDDWAPVASVREAVRARLDRRASAKQTPLETADLLTAAAATLDNASSPDLQVLAGLARYHAHKQRAEYQLELYDQIKDSASLDLAEEELKGALADWESLERFSREGESEHPGLADVALDLDITAKHRKESPKEKPSVPALAILPLPKPLPRPQIEHVPPKTAVPDQPLTVTLQIASPKDVKEVRLHYRNNIPASPLRVMQKAGEASVSFTIPASDIPVNSDLIYYFEILNAADNGWFQPDPLAALPYHVSIAAPVN